MIENQNNLIHEMEFNFEFYYVEQEFAGSRKYFFFKSKNRNHFLKI